MTNKTEELFKESLVLDTETTSLDFRDAEVIQLATYKHQGKDWALDYNKFFRPHKPISPKVSSITYISNRMVEDCEFFEDSLVELQEKLNQFEYLVAHNSFYDKKVLERYGLTLPKLICTMRLAKKLYNDNPAVEEYNLPYLRYALDLPIADDVIAHRADTDSFVTSVLFEHLVNKAIDEWFIKDDETLGDQIVAFLDEPIIFHTMPFGKYKGQNMQSVPLSYWQWALENMDSLNNELPEYDVDFASSVAYAVEKIFEKEDS